MSDERLRELERAAIEGGLNEREALHQERARRGVYEDAAELVLASEGTLEPGTVNRLLHELFRYDLRHIARQVGTGTFPVVYVLHIEDDGDGTVANHTLHGVFTNRWAALREAVEWIDNELDENLIPEDDPQRLQVELAIEQERYEDAIEIFNGSYELSSLSVDIEEHGLIS